MRISNFRLLVVAVVSILAGNTLFAQRYEIPSDRPSKILCPRTEAALYKLIPEDTYRLPWDGLREENIVWKRRVWRDIDIHDQKNEAFVSKLNAPLHSDLISILIQGVFDGKYKAYSAVDDRFTKELSKDEFIKLLTPGGNAGIAFNPEKVTKFRIKEDWLYLDTQQIVVVRILGIAPVVQVTMPDGTITEQAAFWIYYPDARNFLAAHKIFIQTKEQDINWDQLFEGRQFNGVISKMNVYPIAPQDVIDKHRAEMKAWRERKDKH
jgi:gliding motility associated protien GldN